MPGKYADLAKAGRVFIGSSVAAGAAIPVSTGTAGTFALWNTSTNRAAELIRCNIGYTSGTVGVGHLGLGLVRHAGFHAGSLGEVQPLPISVFTDGVARNALTGGGPSAMRFAPLAPVTIATGFSSEYLWFGNAYPSTTTSAANELEYDFDGTVFVMPGTLVHIVASVAQAGVFSKTLIWAEVDI